VPLPSAPIPMADPPGPARRVGRPHPLVAGLALALALVLAWTLARPLDLARALDSPASPGIGAPGMLQPHTESLLVDYYQAFLRDKDVNAFRVRVSARYSEGTLARVLRSGEVPARRASVLALGLFGGFGSNAAVARGLRDPDPTVRTLSDNALWAIWFRADSPENNRALEQVHDRISRGEYAAAVEQADRLVDRAPRFAEAYNQRAIARFFQGDFAASAADCRKVLEHNPYHVGALSGMGQCQIRLGRVAEAIRTFRRAQEVQPFNEGLRAMIADLEAGNR
jgi:tetratricopeptide (TPR) repeat protein